MSNALVLVEGDVTRITDLTITDPVVAGLLGRQEEAGRAEGVRRMLVVGARGLTSMGLGVDIDDIDRRVGRAVSDALDRGRQGMSALLDQLIREVGSVFDPDTAGSVIDRSLRQLEAFRQELTAAIDPKRVDSHTAALIQGVAAMLGPGGALEERLRRELDPTQEGSPLGSSLRRLEEKLSELVERWIATEARATEAEAGTRKGFDYEEDLDLRLRAWARPRSARVERTSRSSGDLGGGLVGDFLIEMPSGTRMVVEAKNTASLSLNGTSGILEEMRRARHNRRAEVGVCVSRLPAFPAEVGTLGVYDDNVLVVDEADGILLEAALTLAAAYAEMARRAPAVIDVAAIASRLDRIRSLAVQLSSQRRALTDIISSVEKVRSGLESLRQELMEAASDLRVATRSGGGEVLALAVGEEPS